MLLHIGILLLQALGFTLIFLIGWHLHVRTSQFYQMASRLPGPPVLPVLGNILDLMGGPDGEHGCIPFYSKCIYLKLFQF